MPYSYGLGFSYILIMLLFMCLLRVVRDARNMNWHIYDDFYDDMTLQ